MTKSEITTKLFCIGLEMCLHGVEEYSDEYYEIFENYYSSNIPLNVREFDKYRRWILPRSYEDIKSGDKVKVMTSYGFQEFTYPDIEETMFQFAKYEIGFKPAVEQLIQLESILILNKHDKTDTDTNKHSKET